MRSFNPIDCVRSRVDLIWDRGTVLVRPRRDEELRPLLERLPGVLYDHRTGDFRAPACEAAEIVRTLRTLCVDVRCVGVSAGRPLPGRWPGDFSLRDYQSAALTAWLGAGRRGVVVLPTGSGKSRVACAAIAAVGVSTLVLVPTRVLLRQWTTTLGRWYRGRVAVLGDGRREVGPITVATYASTCQHAERIGNRFGLVVGDEVHNLSSDAWTAMLDMCTAPARLGLTAALPEETERLVAIHSRFGQIVCERRVADMSSSAVAPLRRVVISCPLEPDQASVHHSEYERFRNVWRGWARANRGRGWGEFVRACQATQAGRSALRARQRCRARLAYPPSKQRELARLLDQHRRERVLVFAPDNLTVYRIARQHLIAAITCDIGRSERDTVLEEFRSGRIRAIVSGRVLNEGVDVPDAEVAIVLGGRRGKLEHIQRIGRVLRPRGGKTAVVYELVVPGTTDARDFERRSEGLA